MKYIKVILTLVFLLNLFARTDGQERQDRQKSVMTRRIGSEAANDIKKNILPWWSSKMPDNLHGGFFGRIDSNDSVWTGADKGGILNARILWTYSAAYRVLKDTAYLALARRAEKYIISHFIDEKYGGAYMSVKANGDTSDTRKQVYTMSFFIYALSEYYRVTGD